METGRRTLDPSHFHGPPDMTHPRSQKPVRTPARASQPHPPPSGGARVPQTGGLAVISPPTRGSLETPLGGIRGNRRGGDSWKQDAAPPGGGLRVPQAGGLAEISTPTRRSLETPLGGIRGNRTYPHSWK